MAVVKSLSILIPIILLSACGGGSSSESKSGSSGANKTPATLTISSNSIPSNLLELETSTMTFNLSGIEGSLDVSVEHDGLPDGSNIDSKVDGSIVTVNIQVADMLKHNAIANFTVTIEDQRASSNQTVNWQGSIEAVNISGNKAYDHFLAQREAALTYVKLEQEQRLLERISKLAAFVNNNTPHNLSSLLLEQLTEQANNEEYTRKLDDALENLDKLTSNYLSGEIDETQMTLIQEPLDNALFNYARAAYEVIQQATNYSEGTVPSYDFSGAVYSSLNDSYSSFLGSPSLGGYVDGHWVFFDEYAYIEPIINPALEICND